MTRPFIRALAFFALISVLCAYSLRAYAQLTEESITEFIEKTTEMTSGQGLDYDPEEIKSFLEEHLHKKARFKSTMKYNIPGYPSQSASMTLDKMQFIESVGKGADSVSDYETNVEIKNIRISKDTTKATVQTESMERGMIPMSSDGVTTEFVPIIGSSSCNQIIMYEERTIQMYSANCKTIINFEDF